MNYERTQLDFKKLIPDFLQDYPDSIKEIDGRFPDPFGPILETIIQVDSDHAHDKKTMTRRPVDH